MDLKFHSFLSTQGDSRNIVGATAYLGKVARIAVQLGFEASLTPARARREDAVADRIEEYAELGIEEFALSSNPHLEEAFGFGEAVLPELRQRGPWHSGVEEQRELSAVPFAGAAVRT